MKIPQNLLETHFIPAVNKGMTSGHKLMITLHGRGDSLHSYKVLAQEINVTGLNYLLCNAPFGEMFGYTWYDDSYDFEDHKYVHSLEKLEALLMETQKQGLALEDTFLFGFSQGGRMVMDLLKRIDKKLAGVVALSPRVSLFENLNLTSESKKTPMFVAHGEYDPIILIKESRENLKVWDNSLEDFQFHTYEMGHEIDIMEIVQLRSWLNERL